MPNPSSSSARVIFPPFSREELIEKLRGGVSSLAGVLPLRRVVLFGSWSTGRATAFSDIDVLVVYEDPRREDAFATVRNHVRVRGLEPHIYTASEAETVADVLERMTRNGVELLGTSEPEQP